MRSLTCFVGLDYHQDAVQVCVMDRKGNVLCNRSVRNNTRAIYRVLRRCGRVAGVAIEACCGAANLAQELRDLGLTVTLAHPGIAARMKQNPDKTDFSDARLLADLLRVGYLPKVWLAPDELRRLRRLVRYRGEVMSHRRNKKLRIRALLRENRLKPESEARPWTKRWLLWLKEHAPLVEEDRWIMDQHLAALQESTAKLREVEKKLHAWADDDAVIQALLKHAGVGLVTAVTLRAEVGEFDRFQNGKQLARYCGVTPRNASSGNRQADAGLIRAGNPQLRVVLIELAHRLIRQPNSHWATLGAKLQYAGKKRNVAVAAVANRWVRWLFHQMQPAALANQVAVAEEVAAD